MTKFEQRANLVRRLVGDDEARAVFIKKDGTTREMRFSIRPPAGEYTGKSGQGKMSYSPTEEGLLPVWDVEKKWWRNLPLDERLQNLILADGSEYVNPF